METATFAGGCFWCLVKPFDEYKGIEEVISGYSGGHVANPTYEQVCTHTTGHREAVQIKYDENLISYHELLSIFFKTFDPTDNEGQFFDRGESYAPAIFYHNEKQKSLAEAFIQDLNEAGVFKQPVITPVIPYKNFYDAESHHQQYYKKAPVHYERYSEGSGRKAFIEKHWGDQDEKRY